MSLYSKIIDLQKLQNSWKRVYRNKPKEGVDEVTCEEFDADYYNLTKELWRELVDHTYKCLPVRLVPLYKGEKVRYISLFTMRDKVIQHSLAKELSNIYEPLLLDCCYAYRSGKSAMHAAQEIEEYVVQHPENYVIKADIHAFFDCILHPVLFQKLREKISEQDVIELIQQILEAPSIDKNGELIAKTEGVYQGATIAPVLSNVYMMEFDAKVKRDVPYYVRYSDDMLLFFDTEANANAYIKQIGLYLESLNLSLNEKKTKIVSVREGFEFLGYAFHDKGMSIPEKAENELGERLEEIWFDRQYKNIEEKLKKCSEILNGWEQYFSGERKVKSMIEICVLFYKAKNKHNVDLEVLRNQRKVFVNTYFDIALYLADFWKNHNAKLWALEEYEEYYQLNQRDKAQCLPEDSPYLKELLETYEKYVVQESAEIQTELIQLYSDLHMYQKAEQILGMKQSKVKKAVAPIVHLEDQVGEANIVLNENQLSRYMQLFVGREDVYAIENLYGRNQRRMEEVLQPLNSDRIQEHINGKETISTYVQRTNGTVKFLVFDLDISKGVLLQHNSEAVLKEYFNKCFSFAGEIVKILYQMGINAYIEESGYRGYHVWVFFEKWIPVRYANLLSDIVTEKLDGKWNDSGIQLELFPNKTKIKNGKKGQCIKLPWGVHSKSGRKSLFVTAEEGAYYNPQADVLADIVMYSQNEIKRIISSCQSIPEKSNSNSIEVDTNLEEFEITSESVKAVLDSCTLMRYLCQKSRTMHYLTHFERLTILYVFGHLGDEGDEFIHKVMSFTLNYSYAITDKFIQRRPAKPISCLKLREQYKQISAEIGCSCNFKRTKSCYPSPVLHAIKNAESNEMITMPISKTVPVERQKIMKDEINAATKVQEIAEKMMDLRKQQRGLNKAIEKCEKELESVFNDANTDSMEIKMGLLVRRKRDGKTEWVIEL